MTDHERDIIQDWMYSLKLRNNLICLMGDIANKTKNVELQRFVLNEYHLQSEELTAFDVFITDK